MGSATLTTTLVVLSGAILLTIFPGCSGKEEKPEPVYVRPAAAPNPMPRFLRGTIRYEADLEGYGSAVASGWGVMVGLDGTGSSDTPIPIRAQIEREASRLTADPRVDNPNKINVRSLLNSKDTAVVIVEAIVPPGAAAGKNFDVSVRAVPGTSTSSLKGGTLWTTNLRIQTEASTDDGSLGAVGVANGEMFINPFAGALVNDDGTSQPRTAVDLLQGRILNGGTMTQDMKLFLHLRTPSHSRSRAMANAINTRFAREAGQSQDTAVPVIRRSDERIQIVVPPSWKDRSAEFVEVLMHTPISTAGLELRADALRRWLIENPVDARNISWSFVALGTQALGATQKLYDFPELAPRLAALKAGAKLQDPLVIPHLEYIARQAGNEYRMQAIELLTDLPANPRSHAVLRELLDDPDTDIQIAAFEGLHKNGDGMVRREYMGPQASFTLLSVPSIKPFIYIRQEGKPMVVVFGLDVRISKPVLVSAWGDRFTMYSDERDAPLQVLYQDPSSKESIVYEPKDGVTDFVQFLARDLSYRGEAPGLGMNYAETVGVLYAIHQKQSLGGPLVLQKDALMQSLSAGRGTSTNNERPETDREDGALDISVPIADRPNSSNN